MVRIEYFFIFYVLDQVYKKHQTISLVYKTIITDIYIFYAI